MNRREALKSVAAALVASSVAACKARPGTEADTEQAGGEFRLVLRGPSIIHFLNDGSRATMHFVGFPYESVCPQPIHRAKLEMNLKEADCISEGEEGNDRWFVEGLSINPQMSGRFSAKDYAQVPAATETAYPAGGDWSSLKWIPKLDVPVTLGPDSKLEQATTTAVIMTAGSLVGSAPHDLAARDALWIWDKPDKWAELEPVAAQKPQHALTDEVHLVGRYAGSEAVLAFTSRAMPKAPGWQLRFRPKKPGGPINLSVIAEPPMDPTHGVDARPVQVYCGFYNVADDDVARTERSLPYLSTVKFSDAGVRQPGLGSPAPRPLCGAMKVIL